MSLEALPSEFRCGIHSFGGRINRRERAGSFMAKERLGPTSSSGLGKRGPLELGGSCKGEDHDELALQKSAPNVSDWDPDDQKER
uniref:Uncharacterized protein n=1 Tax=Bursaphelenchus xylophilus TaxID=6326 RepID=A0A1I7RTB3_BURXY